MGEMVGIIIFAFSALLPLAGIGAVVYIIVTLTRNKDGKQTGFKLSAKTLFQIYLYLISFVTLGFAVLGASIATKAALSYSFGMDFSYTLYQAQTYQESKKYDPIMIGESFKECSQGEAIEVEGKKYCVDYSQRVSDLINGVTMFASMTILFLIHQLMITRIDTKKILPWLQKLYTFTSLILYSIIGIISIPVAIYQLTNYLVVEVETYSTPTAPAMAIAVALITLPLWIFFLTKTSNLKEED